MNVLEAISQRRSVRQYADTPVPRELIAKLLDAATEAPSAMNTQPWAFGVIEGRQRLEHIGDKARLGLLAELDARGVTGDFRDRVANPDMRPFYGAPALVVIYATNPDDFAPINCSLAAQNLMLAATELGLGTCWIGVAGPYLNSPQGKTDFGVPDDCKAIAALIVGYPAGETEPKEKNPPNVLFWE